MTIIRFYRINEPYGFLSNFAPYPIFIDNELWKTVEHYFQASKFEDESLRTRIRELDSPMKTATEGRSKKNIIRKDWDDVKESIMHKAILAKFLRHPKLRKELLLTGNNTLVEHTESDNYWADGGDVTGKNKLGELLMNVRDEIKKYSDIPGFILPTWIAFPSINQNDLFWRMGIGEEYLTQWATFYLESDKDLYRKTFPENKDWEGIYD